jgi:hypothetical protein
MLPPPPPLQHVAALRPAVIFRNPLQTCATRGQPLRRPLGAQLRRATRAGGLPGGCGYQSAAAASFTRLRLQGTQGLALGVWLLAPALLLAVFPWPPGRPLLLLLLIPLLLRL